MKKWFDGIYLLGQYNALSTGCWLLTHKNEGAILELPPYSEQQNSPAQDALAAATKQKVKLKYIFCTHAHWDHISSQIMEEFYQVFPEVTFVFHRSFAQKKNSNRFLLKYLQSLSCSSEIPRKKVKFFSGIKKYSLAGEAVYLIYAPKHSTTDTFVIFRGTACTGDWELGTIRSVHDSKLFSVSLKERYAAIDRVSNFEKEYQYQVHRIFSVHANDRRERVNFSQLIRDCKEDRKLW